MYKITCDYCFEDNLFPERENRPVYCENCNSQVDHLEVVDADEKVNLEEESEKNKVLDGLIMTCQNSSIKVDIPHGEIVVLGRQNTGSEIFAKIPHISREHCKIEYLNGQYLLTDLNSLNGTYLGIKRRDCRKYIQQKINDVDVIYLGREVFQVRLKYRLEDHRDKEMEVQMEEEIQQMRFKCRACGKIHTMNLIICDSCGSYGQIEPLES